MNLRHLIENFQKKYRNLDLKIVIYGKTKNVQGLIRRKIVVFGWVNYENHHETTRIRRKIVHMRERSINEKQHSEHHKQQSFRQDVCI